MVSCQSCLLYKWGEHNNFKDIGWIGLKFGTQFGCDHVLSRLTFQGHVSKVKVTEKSGDFDHF